MNYRPLDLSATCPRECPVVELDGFGGKIYVRPDMVSALFPEHLVTYSPHWSGDTALATMKETALVNIVVGSKTLSVHGTMAEVLAKLGYTPQQSPQPKQDEPQRACAL